MATGTASSHIVYALSDDCCCAMRSAGAEMAMKLLASRSTSSTLAPTGSGCRIGAGAGRHGMPVAEDILETDPAGQSLVERADRNHGDLADEIGFARPHRSRRAG